MYKKLALTTALVAGLGSVSAQAAEMTLKLSHFVPKTIGLHTDFMEPWARDLESCTGGKVAVEIHGAGSALGHIAAQYDQVRAGVVDIAFGHTGIPRGRFPRTSLIELPFMVDSANAGSFALYNLAETYLKPEYPGVRILGMMTHNPGKLHANVPLKSLEDLKGLRIRTPNPTISAILEKYGASPIGLPPGEMYEALQKGTIDGVAIDWTGIDAYKLGEVVSHHLDAPLYTVGFYFVMNQKRYDALPDDVRACVDQLSGEKLVATFGPLWDKWAIPGMEIAESHGADAIVVATPEQVAAWQEELAPVTQALVQEVIDAGVDNAEEIRAALKAEAAKYE